MRVILRPLIRRYCLIYRNYSNSFSAYYCSRHIKTHLLKFDCTKNLNNLSFSCGLYYENLHNFSTMPSLSIVDIPKGKIFTELENDVFHAYLENNSNYSKTIHKSCSKLDCLNVSDEDFNNLVNKEDWTDESADNYFNSFIKIASYCQNKELMPISDPIFNHLCAAFQRKSIHFSDEQLIKCFVCIQNWSQAPSVRDENFLKVWKALDAVCVMKRMNWDLNHTLYMIDLWYSLKLTRLSEFVMKSVLRLLNKARRLNQYNLVQLSFYVNTLRKVPKGESLFEIEYQLMKHLESLTIEEIGIVCAGFFKSQSRSNINEFMDYIILALTQHKENVNPITLAIILKFIRYSHKYDHVETIKKMYEELCPHMEKYSLQVLVHYALVSETRNVVHLKTMKILTDKFLSSPSNARLKDVEKISKLLSISGKPDNESAVQVCRVIVSELESKQRQEEIKTFPRMLIKTLANLSHFKVYSRILTSDILKEDFLLKLYVNKYNIEREVLLLDQNIKLEFPNYEGNRLEQRLVDYLSKKHSLFIPGMLDTKPGSYSQRNLKNIMVAIRTLSQDRDNFWHCAYFLPHFPKADVLVHLGRNNELMEIPSEIKERKYFTGCISPPRTSGRWVLLVSVDNLNLNSDNEITVETITKLRQLVLFGYSPIPIPFYELNLCKNAEEELDCIKKKLFSL